MNKKFQWWITKIDRLGAWVLLASVIAFFVTSYGMENGFLDGRTARLLHFDILPAVAVFAFAMHTIPAVRFSLIRWNIWNSFSKLALGFAYFFLLAGFVYAAYFYRPEISTENPSSNLQDRSQVSGEPDQKIFTVQELAKYDGRNGNPAYIAVDGNIYDVSSLFVNGKHYGCSAGRDVTFGFYQEHLKSILKDYPIVGTLD